MRKLLMAAFAAVLVGMNLSVAAAPKAEAGKKVVWLTDFKAAQQLAQKENKVMLVDFSGSDWCIWCMRLEKEVFSQKVFQEYAEQNLVLVLIDFPKRSRQTPEEKAANEELMKKYGIRGFPTVLLMKPDGKVIVQTGYRRGGAQAYVTYLKEQLK